MRATKAIIKPIKNICDMCNSDKTGCTRCKDLFQEQTEICNTIDKEMALIRHKNGRI